MTRYPGGPGASPGFLMWHLTLRWQRVMAETLTPLGLTHVQFVLLASLTYLERPVNQKELAAFAVADPMMTSQVIRGLEQRNLVLRVTDPQDARAKAVSVTPAGADLANAANAAVEYCDATFFGALGPDVAALLGRI